MPDTPDLPIYKEASHLLEQLEAELRHAGFWSSESPSAEALASTAPFCVDSLSMPQWLQFVFLPRMKALIDNGLPLPAMAIAPMAEEAFRPMPQDTRGLLWVLRQLDNLVSGGLL